MKTYEEISAILATMPDEEFEKLSKADNDYLWESGRVSRNGKARLLRGLAKYGLTFVEWEYWDAQ